MREKFSQFMIIIDQCLKITSSSGFTLSSGLSVLVDSNFIRPPSKRLFGGHGLKFNQIGQDWCQITHIRGC